MTAKQYKPGDLQVWWIPQVGARIPSFEVDVASVEEGALVLQTLARYDQFQLDNRIKGDYCNVGGLRVWVLDSEFDETNKPGWTDWYDDDTGSDDPVEFVRINKETANLEDTDLDLHSDTRTYRSMTKDGFEVFDDELGLSRRVHLVSHREDPCVGVTSDAYWLLEKVEGVEPL